MRAPRIPLEVVQARQELAFREAAERRAEESRHRARAGVDLAKGKTLESAARHFRDHDSIGAAAAHVEARIRSIAATPEEGEAEARTWRRLLDGTVLNMGIGSGDTDGAARYLGAAKSRLGPDESARFAAEIAERGRSDRQQDWRRRFDAWRRFNGPDPGPKPD